MTLPVEDVAMNFVKAINAKDVDRLVALMTNNHTFVDSAGTVASGKDKMKSGWQQFYQMFPDFHVEIDEILHRGAVVALFGSWSGTFSGKDGPVPENRVEGPAAWRAIVAGEKIEFWQIYTDHTNTTKIVDSNL